MNELPPWFNYLGEADRDYGWQMWSSGGAPTSPVMDTVEDLARWLADHGPTAFGGIKATYDQWLEIISVQRPKRPTAHVPGG